MAESDFLIIRNILLMKLGKNPERFPKCFNLYEFNHAKRFIEELTQRYTLDQLKLAFKID